MATVSRVQRERVNFMVDHGTICELREWIPEGERSDFINEALENALVAFKRRKAFQGMDELRKRAKIRMSDKEIRKYRNYGRN